MKPTAIGHKALAFSSHASAAGIALLMCGIIVQRTSVFGLAPEGLTSGFVKTFVGVALGLLTAAAISVAVFVATKVAQK
jgi:hypothetical protein